MEGLMKLSTLVIVCMLVAAPMASDAAISCGAVTGNLGQCYNYLTRGGFIPRGCCSGVQRLNSMARTTRDRQQACRCIQGAARSLGSRLNAGRAARLPGACHVRISYPISARINCNTVR
ncbi:PREDICTED: non-specific lipid-transfer protein 5-like [Camelina sativa]|uniref:Non-specific lipid-transfer protein n=1 Tax=Camelina sativa TaxID=90675 RepID=A0ABM0ZGY1_CAMSA|nr:PREDICTED: non-specific lipid-transfer protein 5-like [Camelina sativa]